MKTLPFALLVVLTFACGKSNDSNSSSKSSDRNGQRETRREFSATVTSKISVTQTEIELLEDKRSADGSCFVEAKQGVTIPFELYENELVLTMNGQDVEFARVSGSAYSMNGKWSREEQSADKSVIVTLEISGTRQMKITNVCKKL